MARRPDVNVKQMPASLSTGAGVPSYDQLDPLPTLASVLAQGNTSEGTSIDMSAGDSILMGQSPPPGGVKGALFVGDGTGGTVAGCLYFRRADGVITQVDRPIPAYIFATSSAPQANLNALDLIKLDVNEASSGGLSVDGTGLFSGFKAGKKYLVDAGLRIAFAGGSVSLICQWRDETTPGFFGEAAPMVPVSDVATVASYPRARGVFAPLVDSDISLKVSFVDVAGVDDVSGSTASAFIRELQT